MNKFMMALVMALLYSTQLVLAIELITPYPLTHLDVVNDSEGTELKILMFPKPKHLNLLPGESAYQYAWKLQPGQQTGSRVVRVASVKDFEDEYENSALYINDVIVTFKAATGNSTIKWNARAVVSAQKILEDAQLKIKTIKPELLSVDVVDTNLPDGR